MSAANALQVGRIVGPLDFDPAHLAEFLSHELHETGEMDLSRTVVVNRILPILLVPADARWSFASVRTA